MKRKFYNLMRDYVFKGVFNLYTQLGFKCISHTLHVFAGTDLQADITLMDKEKIIDLGDGKKMIMDLLFMIDDNLMINMEAQQQKVSSDPDRLINYLSSMDLSLLKAGSPHNKGKSMVLYFMGYPYPEGQNGMMRLQNGMMVTDKFTIKFIPVHGLKQLLSKDPKEMTQEERYRVYLGYSHVRKYQGLMRQLEEMEEGLMAIHQQVISQRSIIENLAQMRAEDQRQIDRERAIKKRDIMLEKERKKRLKEEQKRKLEEQKRLEEQQKRKLEHQKYNYIIQLIKEGYSVDKAEQEANRKFVDVLV